MKWSEEKAHKNFLAKQLMPGLDGVNALEQLVYAIVDMRAEDVAKLQEEIESESAAVSANRAGAVFGPGTMLSMSVGTERTKALLDSYNVGHICNVYCAHYKNACLGWLLKLGWATIPQPPPTH